MSPRLRGMTASWRGRSRAWRPIGTRSTGSGSRGPPRWRQIWSRTSRGRWSISRTSSCPTPLCERLGALLAEDARSPLDVRVSPDHLAEATLAAAEASVEAALPATTEQTDAWRGPWRVLTALTAVLPYPFPDAVDETITRLRALPTGRVLPTAPRGPEVTGPVLWTSDRYGSRFAVTASIMTAEEPVRWYLWDIDACGHEALTVHSGYYPSSAAAFTDWQTGVGQTASAGTVLAPVDDPWLLADLLPAEMGFMRPGGENVEQFTEYHRSKRFAEAVKASRALPRPNARSDAGLTAAAAAAEFAAWLRTRAPSQLEPPENLDELVEELAGSWNLNSIDASTHVFPAPGRPVRAAHAQLLPRRLRRATGGAAARLDPMAGHTQRHRTGAGRPLPALRARPTTPAARRRRHEGRLPRTRRRVALRGGLAPSATTPENSSPPWCARERVARLAAFVRVANSVTGSVCPASLSGAGPQLTLPLPVGCPNSDMALTSGQAAVSYSLTSPPRVGRRRILP